ncbi:YggT family protein [Neisseria sp. HSC-16F19]|nr:YggT family protein [Neisseria sp. HSC-16F19]MCP2039928.1 YggT family protein [Neisseria sp. HSC-16F19]
MMAQLLLLLADALAIVCWSRLLLQWGQLHYRHPLAQFCSRSTDWLVQPLRKIAPPLGRWDSACVLAALLIYYLAYTAILLTGLADAPIGSRAVAASLLLTVLSLTKALAYALLLGLVVQMVLSFSAPHAPLMLVLRRIFLPLSRPFAALRIGRVDFSLSVWALLLWLWLSQILPALIQRIHWWWLWQ